MAKDAKKKRNVQIMAETKRLTEIYANIEDRRKKTIVGLIERAAFQRISLDELEAFLNENDVTEMFSQGNQEPYSRERPEAKIYNNLNSSYQKIIKQLTDLLPKEEARPVTSTLDVELEEFDNF